MLLVVRYCSDRWLRLLGKRDDEIGWRSHSVTDQKDHRSSLESADCFTNVADREDADAVEPKPFERVLQRLRHPLDHDHDRRRPGRGGTTDLIFEERPARERKQRAKT